MRSYAILLLFCALSRVIDATRDCKADAERVIAANGGQQIVYDEPNKRLYCADGENAPKAIEWESMRFKALEWSDEDQLWRDPSDFKDANGEAMEWNIKMADAHNPPTVKCVDYCAMVGEGIERTLGKDNSQKFYRRVNVKCSSGLQLFINNKPTNRAMCTSENEWTIYSENNNVRLLTTATFTPLQAECIKPCHHGKRAEGVVSTVNEGRTVINCDKSNNNGEKYGITVNGGTIYSYLKCDQNGYTSVNNVTVADVYEAVNIECANGVTFSESSCLYNFKDPLQMRYDSATKTLTCVDEADKLMAIEFNSKLYKSLTCNDFGGWMEGSNIIAEAFTKIESKCVEYCAVRKLENTKLNTLNSGERTISCYENSLDTNVKKDLILIVNDQPSLDPNAFTICDLKLGWTKRMDNLRLGGTLSNDTSTPARVACKRACTQITTDSEVQSTPMENDKENTLHTNTFTCSKPDKQKYGIRVNRELVYTNVYCDENGLMYGYINYQKERKVADPFKPVHLDCALFPTTTTTTTTTTTSPAPTTSTVPESPTEKAEKVPPTKPSKPTGDDDDHPRSTKLSIFSIPICSMILILVGNGNP